MDITIRKIDNYYKLTEKYGCHIFIEPIPNRLKIITLIITKKLPIEIREQILEKLTIEMIKEQYICEKVIENFEDEEINLYYKEKIYLVFNKNHGED